MRIADNGHGIEQTRSGSRGLGLRNMQERMDRLGGTLRVLSTRSGTAIEADVPLSHLLPPESGGGKPAKGQA